MGETKWGDQSGWTWHVYEVEGHGMSYEIQLESEHKEEVYRFPPLNTLYVADAVVSLFRNDWGGGYEFHSIEQWYRDQAAEQCDADRAALLKIQDVLSKPVGTDMGITAIGDILAEAGYRPHSAAH